MKNKVDYKQLFIRLGKGIWRSLYHNFWYKLLSVVVAVFLWSYVITANPSITREKVLDVDISISGQSALSGRGFALLENLDSDHQTAQVRISVPQTNYNSVTESNVRVELDLSSVRKTGLQQVRVRATSVYGTVLQVKPETLELEIDKFDQRTLSVNVRRTGENGEVYWYKDKSVNPSTITISGPETLVQRATEARVDLDLTARTTPGSWVMSPVILDASGIEIEGPLVKSASSVSVAMDIYPQKLLPVTINIDELITGELPQGYEFDGDIELQPSEIWVAAEQTLLDSLTSISIAPVDVSRATRSINRNTPVNKLPDVKNYSSDTVNVKLGVSESDLSREFSNVSATLINISPDLRAKWSNPSLKVTIMGLHSIVLAITREDIQATVDLSEIEAPGTYELPIWVSVDNYPELGWSVTPSVAKVTITAK